MKYFYIYFLLISFILPLFGCQQTKETSTEINNNSYINNFELLHEIPKNQISVKITSPKAIIYPKNNDIEIFQSSIDIYKKNSQDFNVRSGYSTLNNLSNIIKGYNNVSISLLDGNDYYITTNSFDWDLNTSDINMTNSININLGDTYITANNGIYNIDASFLKIDNPEFNRNVFNSKGLKKYHVKIKADLAKWYKLDNRLEFISNEKQVESTIKFLSTKKNI